MFAADGTLLAQSRQLALWVPVRLTPFAAMRIGAPPRSSARVLLTLAPSAAAQECMTADPPPVTKPAHALRFGITPGAAGSAGATRAQVAPDRRGARERGAARPAPARRKRS